MEAIKVATAEPETANVTANQAETGESTTAAIPPAETASTHCPHRRTTDLLQRLAPNKMRVGFLIGAGCSLSVRDAAGKPLIPDIDGLTMQVKEVS